MFVVAAPTWCGQWWGNSRNDDVVACPIFGDVLIHPVSAAEGDVMWKCIFRNTIIDCIRGRDRKRAKHMLAGRRKVIDLGRGEWMGHAFTLGVGFALKGHL